MILRCRYSRISKLRRQTVRPRLRPVGCDPLERIFSRDCAEYHIKTPTNDRLIVLVNHFKSKGFGSQATSDRKRETQAKRVKAIYEDLRQGGASNVAVIGDFNDTPDSDPLASLIQSTDLKDITTHQNFNDGGRSGLGSRCDRCGDQPVGESLRPARRMDDTNTRRGAAYITLSAARMFHGLNSFQAPARPAAFLNS